MANPFAGLWIKLRRDAGFKTPYEFYSRSGGRSVLQMSFVTYWKIEKGRILPKAERLGVLVSRLRLSADSPAVGDLARIYLRSLLGTEQAYDWMMRAISAQLSRPSSGTMADKAMQRAVWEDVCRLSVEQNEAILQDYASYWAFMLLANDAGTWEPGELAKRIGVKKPELSRALKSLGKLKLLKLQPYGKVGCPLAGRHVRLPPQEALRQGVRHRFREYHERMIKTRGTLVSQSYSMPRAEEVELSSYFPHLNNAVTNAVVYSAAEGSPRTAQFLVEGNVYRLFPF